MMRIFNTNLFKEAAALNFNNITTDVFNAIRATVTGNWTVLQKYNPPQLSTQQATGGIILLGKDCIQPTDRFYANIHYVIHKNTDAIKLNEIYNEQIDPDQITQKFDENMRRIDNVYKNPVQKVPDQYNHNIGHTLLEIVVALNGWEPSMEMPSPIRNKSCS